jgi:2',3'-cyclic-nucleotide 2'-phosphodiesterase (5'-nucleotidase family)
MKRYQWLRSSLILLALLAACARESAPVASPSPSTDPTAGHRRLVILYTNDEHGWMEATDESGGAAGLMRLWREKEGYTDGGPFLILSGGDMWTGPAISTWFDGESMTEVMNAMGYAAAAIGNHEFDFGLDGLAERAAQSEFPFLAANLHDKASGAPADIALPYTVQQVNGIYVGLIGLSSLDTPLTTKPDNVASLDFVAYERALSEIAPQVRADGAELLVVVGHLCASEMRALVPTAAELGVAVIGGGHCHERVSRLVDGVALIAGGQYLQGYAKAELTFDTAADVVVQVEVGVFDNPVETTPDPEIAALVAHWRAQTDAALSQVIGYTEKGIQRRSNQMFNMVTDAWLQAYPSADVAMTNTGGFRQAIPPGEITLADIVGVLPFDNVLIDVELRGAQLRENLQCCHPVVGGMTTLPTVQLADGAPLDDNATYHVLVNDFMYGGGDDFRLQSYDPAAYNTAIDWRQPVIDWISALDTSPENPLDAYLDPTPRQR